MNVGTASSTVFGYFVNLVTIFGLLTWISILASHINFVRARKAQGIPNTRLVYVAPLGMWGFVGALCFSILIAIFKGFQYFTYSPSYGKFDYKDFITAYLGIPLYLGMILGFKLLRKSKRVSPNTADLVSGKAFIATEEAKFLEQERAKDHGKIESKWDKIYRLTIGIVL